MAGKPVQNAMMRYINEHGGVDRIIERTADGESLSAIAAECGVSRAFLSKVLNRDPVVRDRLTEARRIAAGAWAEQAMAIADAATPQDERVARLRIEQRRWMAARAAPDEYSERSLQGPAIHITANHLHLQALQALTGGGGGGLGLNAPAPRVTAPAELLSEPTEQGDEPAAAPESAAMADLL